MSNVLIRNAEKVIFAIMAFWMCLSVRINVKADDIVPLDQRIHEVMAEYGMDDSSLSVVYYDTVTGERYALNDTSWMIAASTYKLPLNMYYYLQEESGAVDPHAYVGGYDLADAHYLSIVQSDNDASEALMYSLGSYSTYKNLMFQTFGDSYYSDLNNISYLAYEDNYFTAGFFMNVLQYLNDHRSDFTELMSYMSDPEQRNGFENNVRNYAPVYQKQGWIDNVNAVCEMVDSPEPYLAVVMVDFQGDHAAAASALNDAVYQYNQDVYAVEKARQAAEEAETEKAAAAAAQKTEEPAETDVPSKEDTQEKGQIPVFNGPVIVCLIIAAGGIAIIILVRRKDKRRRKNEMFRS